MPNGKKPWEENYSKPVTNKKPWEEDYTSGSVKKKVATKPVSQEELWGSDSQPQDLYTSLATGAQEPQQVSDGLDGAPKMGTFTGFSPEELKTLQGKPAIKVSKSVDLINKRIKLQSELSNAKVTPENQAEISRKTNELSSIIKEQDKISNTRLSELEQKFKSSKDENFANAEAEKRLNNLITNTGVWNNVKSTSIDLYNNVVDGLSSLTDEVGIKELKVDTDPLSEEKNKVIKDALKKKVKLSDQEIEEAAKKLYKDKQIDYIETDNINSFLDNLDDEDKNLLKQDRLNRSIHLQEDNLKQEKVINAYEVVGNKKIKEYQDIEKELIRFKSENKELPKDLYDSYFNLGLEIKGIANNISKRQGLLQKNKEDLGTVKQEFDFFKRQYGDVENFLLNTGTMARKLAVNTLGGLNYFGSLGGLIDPEGKNIGVQKDVIRINADIDNQRDNLRKSVESIESAEGFVNYVSDIMSNQIPSLVATSTGAGGLALIGVSTSGEKYADMNREVIEGKATYSPLQMAAVPFLYGASEVVSEIPTLSILKKGGRLLESISKNEADLITKSVKEKAKEWAKDWSIDTGKEIAGEEFTNFAQNFTDKYVLGKKDVGLLDNAGTVLKDTFTLTSILKAAPHVAGAILKPHQSNSDLLLLDENSRKIIEFTNQLDSNVLTEKEKSVVSKQMNNLVAKNSEIISNTIDKVDNMPVDIYKKVIELNDKAANIKSEAVAINDGVLPNKKELLKELSNEYKLVKDQRNALINAEYKNQAPLQEEFDRLDDAKKIELKDKASKILIEDARQRGLKEFEFNDKTITEKALELFKKEDTKPVTPAVEEPTIKDSQIPLKRETFEFESAEGEMLDVEVTTNKDGTRLFVAKNKDGRVISSNKVGEDNTLTTEEYVTKGYGDIQGEVKVEQGNDIMAPAMKDKLTPKQKAELGIEEAEVTTTTETEPITEEVATEAKAKEYSEELDKTKESDPEAYWSVSPVSAEDAAKSTIIDTPDGAAIVKPDGDIAGLFKKATSKAKGVAQDLLKRAVAAGGKKLDNFDTYLTPQYIKAGFRVVSRTPFNEEYAPEGWNKEKHGTPDVVTMVYDPEGKLDIEEKTFDDYDEAMAYRDSFLEPSIEMELEGLAKLFDESDKGFKMSQVDKAKEALKSILPGVKFIVHETNEAYKNATGSSGSGGTYIMYSNGDKVIHINKQKANGRTVAHEVFHAVILDKIKGDKAVQEITARMMKAVYKTASPELKSRLDEFAARYSDESIRDEERLAELIGIIADGYPQMSQINKGIVKRWLDALAKMFGRKPFTDNEVIDLLNTLAGKISTGEVISENDIKAINEGVSTYISVPTFIKRFQKTKEEKVEVGDHELSFVKKSDLIDMDSLMKDISNKKEKVWFWVADQLGRGNYSDKTIGKEHYLDAGPSFALDPVNRDKNVIWASGASESELNKNINKSDYIFIISGSPQKSKLFNKQVFNLFEKRIGDYSSFKKQVLESGPTKPMRDVLNAHDSWNTLREDASVDNAKTKKIGTGRKKFLIALLDAMEKPKSKAYNIYQKRNAFVDINDLRDGFYKDNNFDLNDIMLVLKPTGFGGKSNHSTYENDILGDVVGVPDIKVNAFDIMPTEVKDKYKKDLKITEQQQAVAPYGIGVKTIERKQLQEPVKGSEVWRHIKDITPYKEDIPGGFKKDIIDRTFKNVDDFDMKSLLKTDPDFKDYYEGGETRYDEDEVSPRDLSNEIVVVDGTLLDGYSRVSTLLRNGEKTTNAYVAEIKLSQEVTKKLQQANTIDEMVRIARQSNYSDAAITAFLKTKGFSDSEIANALKPAITEDEAYDKFKSEAKKSRDEITNKKTVKEYIKDKYKNIIKNWSNRQVEAQSLLSKTGMVNTLNLSINSHGYSGKAKRLFQKSYDKIYKGLSTKNREILDEVIQAKRFIAIDNNRAERGLDPVKHPNYINKNESQMYLDKLKKEIGDKAFNNISARADEYFSTYKKLLKDVYDNGLISKESYDSMSDVDYQPRVFLQFVTDFDGDLKTSKNSVDSTSLSSDQIKSMKEGDVNSLVTNSEWLLSNSLVARTNAMAKNNINKRFMTDEFPKAKERFDKLDPKNLKGDDVRFYKYFKELQSKVIDNPIIGYTDQGNPKYKYDDIKSPLNFTKAYYYVNGVQNQFFLEDELHKSWMDNVDGFLSRDAKEILSYTSGSALVKAIATGNNPAFPIVNTPRDLMFTAAFSEEYSNLTPLALGQIAVDVAKSIKEIAKKDSAILNKYYEYGGAMDFLSSQGRLKKDSLIGSFIDKMIPANIRDITKGVFNTVTLKKVSEYSEVMFRLGIFQRSINNSLKELGFNSMSDVTDKQQVDDIYNAAVASARGILDFNKGGVAAKDLESIIPYVNVAFQGGSVALNAFKKNPVATTSRIFQIATIASTIPAGLSLFLIAASKDDDDDRTAHEIYLDAMSGVSKYQKSKYMNIVTGTKNEEGQYKVIKIAKAQELSPVISVTDDITENIIRGVAGKDPKPNETIVKNAMFSLKHNVLPFDITSPSGIIVRNPMIKSILTYQTGYDFFRDEPLAMNLEAKPAPYEGLDMKNVEGFYKDLGPKYGISPVRSKAFVESLITTPDTNPFIGILYGGAEAMSSNKDAKNVGENLVKNIYKSTGKRLISYTSDFNRNLEAKQKLEEKIGDIKLEDAILKSKIKIASDQYIAKDITKDQLMDEFKDLDPFDKKRALMKIRDKKVMKNIDSNIIDIKYEKSAKIKALMISSYYGDIFDKSEDSKDVIKQMARVDGILTPEVRYELKKIKDAQ